FNGCAKPLISNSPSVTIISASKASCDNQLIFLIFTISSTFTLIDSLLNSLRRSYLQGSSYIFEFLPNPTNLIGLIRAQYQHLMQVRLHFYQINGARDNT